VILADGQHQTQTFHFRPKLKGSGGYCVSGTLMTVEGRMGHSALEQTLSYPPDIRIFTILVAVKSFRLFTELGLCLMLVEAIS
jgi:hypothetical protein